MGLQKWTTFAGILFSSLFIVNSAQAIPFPPQNSRPLQLEPSEYDFTGIIELSNCSGSLIRYTTSESTDRALVLTNGHCNQGGFPDPGEVLYGVPSRRSLYLLNSRGSRAMDLRAQKIVYGTMTGTDMLIYELEQTYGEIFERTGQEGLLLSPTRAEQGISIEVISGYWVRGYACNLESFPYRMRESNWEWHDSLRYSRPGCEVIGGTSGSPVVDRATRMVVGVNNTINENGYRCSRNNPCEIDKHGTVFYQKGIGYAQQTYWVYTCLNENREVDLSRSGCLLAK